MKTKKYTTIRISSETYEELSRMGNLQDSFDIVIRRLLDQWYKKQKQQ